MLKLPPGFVPQVESRREVGFKSYEFNRVYRADGHMDPGRSFWVMTPLDQGERPQTREITFADYQAAAGRGALSFDDFKSHDIAAETIEGWFPNK